MKRSATAWVAVAVVAAAAACEVPAARAPEVGALAPSFVVGTLEGGELPSEEFLGGPYLLNIWATWCAPCRREMPHLQDLHDAYADQGFQVVGVSVDDGTPADLIRAFAAELAISFPLYHDVESAIMDHYMLLGLPGSFLIDADGRIARKWTGPFDAMADDVQADVQALIDLGRRSGGGSHGGLSRPGSSRRAGAPSRGAGRIRRPPPRAGEPPPRQEITPSPSAWIRRLKSARSSRRTMSTISLIRASRAFKTARTAPCWSVGRKSPTDTVVIR